MMGGDKRITNEELQANHDTEMRRIRNEMEKISRDAAFESLTLQQKIKKQYGKIEKNQLNYEMMKHQWKTLNASFKSQDRESVHQAFASKTNSPIPGKYNPRWSLIEKREQHVKYIPEPENKGTKMKLNLGIKKMSLCPHAIRTIEEWAHPGKKKQVLSSIVTPSKMEQTGASSSFAKNLSKEEVMAIEDSLQSPKQGDDLMKSMMSNS